MRGDSSYAAHVHACWRDDLFRELYKRGWTHNRVTRSGKFIGFRWLKFNIRHRLVAGEGGTIWDDELGAAMKAWR